MLQPSPVAATPLIERLRTGAGRRALGISLALLIEGLLLLVLFSLGTGAQPGEKETDVTIVTLQINEAAEEAPEPRRPDREQPAEAQPAPEPPAAAEPLPRPEPPQPAQPLVLPTAPTTLPTPQHQPPSATIPPSPARPSPPAKLYGPPSRGGSASRDTERVGTAPNGEPLYAASWYREPTDAELGAYLSTASGPGWGLIACRTAPGYRVEDCVGLAEYPQGSQITRAVLAAAWEFKVRPPRLGGQPQVGSWVRNRIDYGIGRR